MARMLVPNGGWQFSVPAGLTPIRQLPHKFQQATVEGLEQVGESVALSAIDEIKGQWKSAYPYGRGTIPATLRTHTRSDRQGGVNINISAGGRHLPYITSLAGGDFRGAPYEISAVNRDYLTFYWYAHGRGRSRWVRTESVQHPGFSRDVLSEVIIPYGRVFRSAMINQYQRGIARWQRSLGSPKAVKR